MPGKRQFARRCENADARRVPIVDRRRYEGRFRKIKLARNRLHRLIVESACVGQHGKGIAAEHAIGEHVAGRKAEVFHSRDFS